MSASRERVPLSQSAHSRHRALLRPEAWVALQPELQSLRYRPADARGRQTVAVLCEFCSPSAEPAAP